MAQQQVQLLAPPGSPLTYPGLVLPSIAQLLADGGAPPGGTLPASSAAVPQLVPVSAVFCAPAPAASAAEPPAAAAATAAASSPGEPDGPQEEMDDDEDDEAGELISLTDGSGPEGLFRVTKARADALLPLEPQELTPGEASKRDRATTARRALAQRGSKPTSCFRGVTHHLRTGRWEAHIWMQGKQMYLGGFDSEREASMAYDLAAVKFRGPGAQLNFSVRNYTAELALRGRVDGEELVATLRRQSRSAPPPATASSYKGVTRHVRGKWEARITLAGAAAAGGGATYLGLFEHEVDAAQAYDRAAVRDRGLAAVTNFDLSLYADQMRPDELELYLASGRCPPEAVAAVSQRLASAAAGAAAGTPQLQQQRAAPPAPPAPEPLRHGEAGTPNRHGAVRRKAAAAAPAMWADAMAPGAKAGSPRAAAAAGAGVPATRPASGSPRKRSGSSKRSGGGRSGARKTPRRTMSGPPAASSLALNISSRIAAAGAFPRPQAPLTLAPFTAAAAAANTWLAASREELAQQQQDEQMQEQHDYGAELLDAEQQQQQMWQMMAAAQHQHLLRQTTLPGSHMGSLSGSGLLLPRTVSTGAASHSRGLLAAAAGGAPGTPVLGGSSPLAPVLFRSLTAPAAELGAWAGLTAEGGGAGGLSSPVAGLRDFLLTAEDVGMAELLLGSPTFAAMAHRAAAAGTRAAAGNASGGGAGAAAASSSGGDDDDSTSDDDDSMLVMGRQRQVQGRAAPHQQHHAAATTLEPAPPGGDDAHMQFAAWWAEASDAYAAHGGGSVLGNKPAGPAAASGAGHAAAAATAATVPCAPARTLSALSNDNNNLCEHPPATTSPTAAALQQLHIAPTGRSNNADHATAGSPRAPAAAAAAAAARGKRQAPTRMELPATSTDGAGAGEHPRKRAKGGVRPAARS